MTYSTPRLTRFGSVSAMTGVFGGPQVVDVLLNENGEVVLEDTLSIDACAERNDKCICADNGTC